MDRLSRIYALHRQLAGRRYPVSHKALEQELGCSRATVTRIIQDLRNFFAAPIEYDREANGYRYEHGKSFELPGLWFSAEELEALLAMQRLLGGLQPGLLDSLLAPFRQRVEAVLASEQLGQGEALRRIRILPLAVRAVDGNLFRTVAGAVLGRKRLHLVYRGRGRDAETRREVSPQRLVHYRDNWYLDAWCHDREALRSFALDRVVEARPLDTPATDIAEETLDAHFAAGYGIFGGAAQFTAVLRFTPERARWVADERWHPDQEGATLADGRFELRFPYSDHRELVMDILKHGPEVEVVGPPELRRAVAEKLRAALVQYEKDSA